MLGSMNTPTFKTSTPPPNSGGNQLYRDPERGLGSTPMGQFPLTPQQQGLQSAVNVFSGIHGPAMALVDQSAGNIAGQIGMTQVGYQQGVQALNQNAALDKQKLNLGPQYDQVERDAIARQLAGLDEQGKLAFLGLGNQFKGFDLQTLQAWQNAAKNQTAARSDATVRGAMTSRGIGRTMGDIQKDLANQVTGIGIQREGAVLGAQEGDLNRKEQAARLQDRNKILDIKAKEYGVDAAKINASLQQGIQKLGLDQFMDVNQLLDALNSTDMERQAIATQIFRDAMTYSDMFTVMQPQSPGFTPPPTGQQNLNPAMEGQRAIDQLTGVMGTGGL